MAKRGKRSVRGKRMLKKVRRVPPSAPDARDEGPRLIPLEDRVTEPSRLEHYLDLADVALGVRKEEPHSSPRRTERNSK